MKATTFSKALFTLIVSTLFVSTSNLHGQTDGIKKFTSSSQLKYAGVGISVVNMETGRTICSNNENMSLTPASTTKLLTTATALEMLGPDYRFETKIMTSGNIDKNGTLQGDLIIFGSGDPTLGSEFLYENNNEFLNEWKNIIEKNEIKSINGNILVVDDLYGYEGVSPRWIWEDMGNYYAPGIYGISVFDNMYRLYLQSFKSGTTPKVVTTDPEIKQLSFENYLIAASNNEDSAYIYGIPFSYNRTLRGTIPENQTYFIIKGDIPDPGMFLAEILYTHLKTNGINISGQPITSRNATFSLPDKNLKEIYVNYGKTLREIIRVTNVRSNNHYAEHLLLRLGLDNKSNVNSRTAGVNKVKSFWKNKGINIDGLFMYDGSGLSPNNRISARLLTDLLVYMKTKSRYADAFFESLPIAGKEGTVKSFLKDSNGKVHLKSGSMANVQAYAGYIDNKNKHYAFSIIVNNFTGSRNELKRQMENFLQLTIEN